MGVAAAAKLVVQIIEACRTRIPTTYELDFPEVGKLIVSGPRISPRQLRELSQLMTEALKRNSKQLKIRSKQDD